MKAVARPAAAVSAALVVAVAVTGCNTSPGAAALVGDYRISTATLQQEVSRALADPTAQSQRGSDRAKFTRDELGQLIRNRIIAAAAAAHHVTVTASEVDQQLAEFAQQAGGMAQLEQSAAQSGVPKNELRTYLRYYVLEQKLGDALVANLPVTQSQLQAAYQQNIDSFDQVHAAHILVKTKKLADQILAKVRKNPKQFAALAARYSLDTSNKDRGGDLGAQPASAFVPSFSGPVFKAKPGSFIEVHTQFGWHVVHIIEHRKVPLSQVADQLKGNVLSTARTQQLNKVLAAEAHRLGVHVNPRYGRWSEAQQAVVPITGGVSSPSPSASPTG
ncbi:MAG TPA: peptidylprolyl isomerase [Mycobacteriales bacterium]|nr:peptidylprolyl isomerase [Mycobacteriales bacterium]